MQTYCLVIPATRRLLDLDEGFGQKYRRNIANCFQVTIANWQPADGFDSNTILSHAVCPNFFAEVAQ